MSTRAIIIVTGATAGIGFGICQRLIDQLYYDCPPDLVQSTSTVENNCILPFKELTLILPCRSVARGEKARGRLLAAAKKQLQLVRRSAFSSRNAESFASTLRIDVHYCDLLSVSSVLEFGNIVNRRYPYITHVINNAGTGSFLGVHLWKALRELVKDPVRAVTAPNYKIEVKGELSNDGLGLVWQCNVFSHYVIYKSILPLLRKSPFGISRIIWMSSLEAIQDNFDSMDWQLTETEMPYEGSKCQVDLISATLDFESTSIVANESCAVRHMIIQPGVVDTDIFGASQIGFFLNVFKLLTFYVARILFSENHTITPYTAAISAVFASFTNQLPKYGNEKEFKPIRYGSKTNWKGAAFVSRDEIDIWKDNRKVGITLVEQMDALYDDFVQKSALNGSGHKCNSIDL